MIQLSASNIVEGLIVSAIGATFLWVGKKYGTRAVDFLSSISKWYSRKIYTEAAEGFTNKIIVVMFYLIVLFIVMFSTFICSFIWDTSTTTTEPSDPAIDKIIENSLGAIIVILNIFLLEFFSRQNVINRNIADFNHKLKIIRLKIDDEKYNFFQQQWALMESENNYNKIYEEIDKYLEQVDGYKPDEKYLKRQSRRQYQINKKVFDS